MKGASAERERQKTSVSSPAIVAQLIADRLQTIEREHLTHRAVHPQDATSTPHDRQALLDRHYGALHEWNQVRLRGDRASLGNVPIVGPLMRILTRTILLGRLSLQQTELNFATLEHLQKIADMDAQQANALNVHAVLQARAEQQQQQAITSTSAEDEPAGELTLSELAAQNSQRLADAINTIRELEAANASNQHRIRQLEQQLEHAEVLVSPTLNEGL